MTRLLILILLFCAPFAVFSQQDNKEFFNKTELDIYQRKNLDSSWQQVQGLFRQSLDAGNYLAAAHSLHLRIAIDDRRTEDSLYFKNSAWIDSALQNPGTAPLFEATLHLMQAKRIMRYISRYTWRTDNFHLKRNDIPVNYAGFSFDELRKIADTHFEKAKTIFSGIQVPDIEAAIWLSDDPLLFLFKPTLYDISIAEQISVSQQLPQPKLPWATGNMTQSQFIAMIDTVTTHKKIMLYSEWIRHYSNSNTANAFFIETLARKFTYETLARYPKEPYDENYELYLQQLLRSDHSMVKLQGVVQLFEMWRLRGEKYCPRESSGYSYYSATKGYYDNKYRDYYSKALDLVKSNIHLLDSFEYVKTKLLPGILKLEARIIKLRFEEPATPGKAILARLTSANNDAVYMRVVKIPLEYYPFLRNDTSRNYLLSLPVVEEQVFSFSPVMNDHQLHSAYIKIGKLPAGKYCILLSDSSFQTSAALLKAFTIQVSQLSVISNNNRVFVLDRVTGFPVTSAKVTISYERNDYSDYKRITYQVNKEGYFTALRSYNGTMLITNGSDSLEKPYYKEDEDDVPDEVYNKNEYDSKLDYYEENITLKLFTDRSIYRPGQKVFFKGIFLVRDPSNGEWLALNKKNIHLSFLKKIFSKEVKGLTSGKFSFFISDPFDRAIDSIKLSMNDYGSVAGSFTIPKQAATGNWSLQLDDTELDIDTDEEAQFSVEEYKRPAFEAKIESPKKMLLPSDSFSFTIKARTFSGSKLGNAAVKYKVTRNSPETYFDSASNYYSFRYKNTSLLDTTGFTNSAGEFAISINDTALAALLPKNEDNKTITYNLEASVTDASGESHDVSTQLQVSDRPVKISVSTSKISSRDKMDPLFVKTKINGSEMVDKKVNLKIYRVEEKKLLKENIPFAPVDFELVQQKTISEWFPYINFDTAALPEPKSRLVLDTSFNSDGSKKIKLPFLLFTGGNYEASLSCNENGKLLGEAETSFSIFDRANNDVPEAPFRFLEYNTLKAGDTIRLFSGNRQQEQFSIYHLSYFEKTGKGLERKNIYSTQTEKAGLHIFETRVPENIAEDILLTRVYILNNKLYTEKETIFVERSELDNPRIIIEQSRQVMAPGSSETFTVSVKTKDVSTAAELLTAMYDASLDKLKNHKWRFPTKAIGLRNREYWSGNISSLNDEESINYGSLYFEQLAGNQFGKSFTSLFPANQKSNRQSIKPLWWLNPLDYAYEELGAKPGNSQGRGKKGYNTGESKDFAFVNDGGYAARLNFGYVSLPDNQQLFGLKNKLQFAMNSGYNVNVQNLNDVVVTSAFSASRSVMVRGANSITSANVPFLVIDGVVYNGDLKDLDINTITDIVVLKDASATALYGSRASNGAIVMSTKGTVVLPEAPEPPVKVRKDFNETAFFFPQLYADKDGYFKFSFTMPESVTEWRWMMLAHTKNAKFAYKEKKLVTQLPLMVQPNMPRLLYQGDKLFLQTRISNLDSNAIVGKITCSAEDAVTGEDISRLLITSALKEFKVAANENGNASFEINVPATQLNPVKIKVTASSGNFSDGEEHLLPILSRRIFVTQSVPYSFTGQQDTTIITPALPADVSPYGMGISITPKAQAALLNSLPYLANYPYDCAEQTFNKMLSYAVSIKLMRTDTVLQQSYKDYSTKIVAVQEEKLPDELAASTMPWLALSGKTNSDREKLFTLLDTTRCIAETDKLIQKLRDMQNKDGGMPWFNGGNSDEYISAYLLQSFAMAESAHLLEPGKRNLWEYQLLVKKLCDYCDRKFREQKNKPEAYIEYLYGRSYWNREYPLGTLQPVVDSVMKLNWKNIYTLSFTSRLKMIIAGLQLNPADSVSVQTARAMLSSIEQQAIKDQHGTRWKDIADNDDLTSSGEETIALLLRAFNISGTGKEIQPGIIKWLLGPKQEHQYSNTKSVAAVVRVLLKDSSASGFSQQVKAAFSAKTDTVSNDLLKGKLFSFERTSGTFPGQTTLKKDNNQPASGFLHYYFFTARPATGNGSNEVSITKKIYRSSKNNDKEEVNESTALKPGDKLTTVITVTANKQLNYVLISDNRAACLEPMNALSGYEYNTGFSYYRSVSDAGFRFFAERIPSGVSTISYETVVSQKGSFSGGTTELQCMYRPEIHSYAGTTDLKIGD